MPARDESATLVELHRRFAQAMDLEGWTYELVLVDDGSEDATWDVIVGLAAAHPEVRGLRHRRPAGIMEAIASGFRVSRGEVWCVLDGDLESRPEELAPLIRRVLAGTDMVSGARAHRGRALSRQIASFALRVVMFATPHRPADFGCGLKAFRSSYVGHVLNDDHAGNGLAFAFSLLRAAETYADLPVSFDARSQSSHFPPAQLARNLRAFSAMALQGPLVAWSRLSPFAAAGLLAQAALGHRRAARAMVGAVALAGTGVVARREAEGARSYGRPGATTEVVDTVGTEVGTPR